MKTLPLFVSLAAALVVVFSAPLARAQTSGACYNGGRTARCSGPAAQVMATPAGAPGSATLRTLVATDLPSFELIMGCPIPALTGVGSAIRCGMQTVLVNLLALGYQDVWVIGAARTVNTIRAKCTSSGTSQFIDVSVYGDAAGSQAPNTLIGTVSLFCTGTTGSGQVAIGPLVLPAGSTYRVQAAIAAPSTTFAGGFVSAVMY